jgi:S-adenosylmethionine-diacylglycerol 3-amino-3-carboxypropyl transferase
MSVVRSEFADAVRLDTIRYGEVWEDHLLLERGLRVGPGDDVLSIASAGCNVLALLLQEPRSVTAVDVSPAQTALLHLKLAAIRRLEHAELARLLGARPGADRIALYERVRAELPPDARAFWDDRWQLIDEGISASGRLERYFAGFRADHLSQLVRPGALALMLSLDDPRAQRSLFDTVIARRELMAAFRWYFGREMMASRGRDPAQFRHVPPIDVGAIFWERFRRACREMPTRGNFYLERFLTGSYADLEQGPLHLRASLLPRLRGLARRVSVVTGSLEELLDAAEPRAFSKANLSDVFEYASEDHSDTIFHALTRAIRPGGRFCYWNLLVARRSPRALRGRLLPMRALATALANTDRAWFYGDFHIEEVLPA